MEKKVIYLGILCLFLVSFVSAYPTYTQGDCINFATISNSTGINISSVNYPDGSVEFLNSPMSKNDLTFNYTFCSTQSNGLYNINYYDADYNVYTGSFYVTYSGAPIDESRTSVNIFLITIFAAFAAFLIFISSQLPDANMKDNENRVIQISWLKYLRFPFYGVTYLCITSVMFLSGALGLAYLGPGISGALLLIGQIMMWTLIPLTVIFFMKLIDDVQSDTKLRKDLAMGVDSDGY